mgnify:FL=1
MVTWVSVGEGSSVDLAKVLDCPVILVVDAGGMSGTIAAVVTGYCQLAEQKMSALLVLSPTKWVVNIMPNY